jgi:hypothetical protein
MKNFPVGAELFYVGRRTYGNDEANSHFSEFYTWAQKQKRILRCGANGGEPLL